MTSFGYCKASKLRVDVGDCPSSEPCKALLAPTPIIIRDIDSRPNFVPPRDRTRIRLATIKPGLLFPRVYRRNFQPSVSFAFRECTLETPVATLSMTAKNGVD